jgi:hypothetical protein
LAVAAIVVFAVHVQGQWEVVVEVEEVVDFQMLIEFEPCEFRHMTLMRLLKMRWYFELSLHVISPTAPIFVLRLKLHVFKK